MSAWWRWRARWILRRNWRILKRRERMLECNNCPLLARDVRVAAERIWVELQRLDGAAS